MSSQWNPFQFQIEVLYLREENGYALLELKKGSCTEIIQFPKALLPQTLSPGESFTLKAEDKETAQKTEREALQHLLTELIR